MLQLLPPLSSTLSFFPYTLMWLNMRVYVVVPTQHTVAKQGKAILHQQSSKKERYIFLNSQPFEKSTFHIYAGTKFEDIYSSSINIIYAYVHNFYIKKCKIELLETVRYLKLYKTWGVFVCKLNYVKVW